MNIFSSHAQDEQITITVISWIDWKWTLYNVKLTKIVFSWCQFMFIMNMSNSSVISSTLIFVSYFFQFIRNKILSRHLILYKESSHIFTYIPNSFR